MCQDTGTAIVLGKKGNCILTDGKDIESLSNGILKCFKTIISDLAKCQLQACMKKLIQKIIYLHRLKL